MGDITAKIPSDNAVPRGVVLLIELFLDVGGNIFFDIKSLHGLIRTVNRILLHFFRHISILDDRLPFCHLNIIRILPYLSKDPAPDLNMRNN